LILSKKKGWIGGKDDLSKRLNRQTVGFLSKIILIREIRVRAAVTALHACKCCFYNIKTGCQWRFLPKDFPLYLTVHSFYWRAKKNGIWEQMMPDLVKKSPMNMGRNPNPSYSLIDSQSVKITDKAKNTGIDGGKKLKAEKDTS
jgi:putative transposase